MVIRPKFREMTATFFIGDLSPSPRGEEVGCGFFACKRFNRIPKQFYI